MNPLWSYFWPIFCTGLFVGAVGGLVGFRRRRRLAFVVAATVALAALAAWHWPLGAAGRFTTQVETDAADALNDLEMTQVKARLHRGPLTRRLILAKPAALTLTDFQTSELARLMGEVTGVSGATWSDRDSGLPLIVEALLLEIGGFLVGLLIAYLIELRRRYNAQWTW